MSDAINAGSLELQLEVDSSKLLADLSAVADKAGKQIERTLQKQIDRLDASRVEATFTNLSNQINRQFSELSRVQTSTLNQLNRSAGNSQGLKLMRREASDLSSSLRELRDAHRQLRDQFRVSTSIKIDTSDLRRTIREIKELRANVSDPFKISTSSEQSRVISQARSRNQVVRVREDSTLFGGIKTGFVEGIGQNIADRFSSGLLDSVESTLGISLKSIGSRIGNRGARVPKIATDHFLKGVGIAGGSEILTKEFNRVLSSWESLTDKSAARIGHSLAKGISGELSEVQKSLAGLFKDITSTGLETVASPLRIRKHILSSNATQEVLKRQSKIAVDQNEAVRQAKSITLVSGGMDFQPGGRANTNFIKEILKPVLPDSYLVPISNPATNDPKGFASEFDQFAQNLLKSVGQEVKGTDFRGVGKLIEMGILKGLNPDAIKMAATAYAYKQAYPDKPINFVGASAGGYASADAAYILSLLGVESKSLGIATPFTGALTLNDPKNLKAPIGLADPIYHKLFSTFPVNPGSFQETYPGIGLKHLIPKFLAEAPVQSTIQDFLGDRIGNISPDVTGKAGYRNMLGFISAKASEAETVKGAINRSLGNPGEESLFYDPKGSRFSQTFLKLHINKLKEVSQKATGKVAQEAAEYIEFLEDFYKQLEQHYASNQEHLPDLPQVSKFFPGIRIPSQPQQPETSSSPRSVKLTADQMGSLLPPNVRSDLERVISTPNRSNSLALGSLSQGKLPRPQEMLDAFETDIVRRVSNVRRSILEIKKNVNSNTPEGMRAAVEVVSGVAQARTALDSLMSELGDSATKPIKKAVKEARRQLTVSENKAKPIAESQTARSLGLDYGGGLSEGLVGSISEVQQAAMRLAEVGTETIREAWDIHSPSKVGIYLGRMLGLGVRLGLISEVEKDEIANSAESVLDKLKQSFNPGQLFGGVGDRFKGLIDGVKGLVGAFAGFAILNQVGKLLDQFQAQAREAAVEAERIERVIIFSSSSKTEGIKNLNFAKDEAKRLSLDLRSSLEGFADFTSSTKGTSLEGEQTNKIFSGVAQFSSVIGLDPQRQELVFKALSQMAGKGVVSMEELRQQLGDSLPGALAIAARSMNMTQQEFINLVKSGNLLAEDFLPKFAAQMSSESSTGLAGSAKSAQSSINRFNNSVYELQVGLGKTLLPLQNMSFDVLGAGLEFVAKHIKEINVLLQTIVGYSALSLLQTLGVAPKTWAAAWLSFKGVLSGVSGALSGVSSAILTLNFSNLIQGIGASVTALSAMLNKFLLVGIAIAGASAALEFFSDKGGKAREASDSMSRSLEKLQKSQSEKPSSNKTWLGKGIDQLSDKAKKGIFGDNDDPNWLKEFIFGSPVSKNNGDPSKEVNQAKEQQDTLKALREFQSGGSRVLGRVASDLNSPLIGAISSLDDQINNQRIKIGAIRLTNPQDTKGLKDAEAQLDELIKRREKLAEIPIANKAALEDFIAQSESLIKDLGDNPAYRDFIEKTLKPQLEMAYKWRDAFNQSIDSASSRLQKFEKAWQRVNDQAEDTSQSIKDLLNTQMASLSDRFASGGLTKGQYESQQQSLQTESLRREIANSEQRIQTLRNELASMNAPSILAQNKLSNAGAAELKTAAEKASDPQTKSVISKSAELKTVESQVTESRKQLAQELAQTAQTFRDFTKSANEFFRGIQKETELLQYDLQSLDLDGKILQVKTKILGALRGTYSTFVDDFAESIIGIFETITEGSKSIINANKENKQRIQAAQDKAKEGTDLKNSAPGEGGTGGGPSVDTKGYTVYSTGGGTSPITNYSQSRPHHTYQKNSLGQDVRDYTFEKGGSVRVDVPSISSGVVTHAGPKGGYGNAVLVKDDTTGEETLVGHLETVHVKTGQRVSFGQSIGIQGSTGQSQAEHVHLEASPQLMQRYIDSVLKGSFPNVGGGSSGSPRPAGGGAGAGSFSNTFGFNSNRAKQAYQFYTSQGFSPQAASYIVGNYMQESSLEEWRKNGEHHGLGQWSSARRSAQGGLPSSFEGQLQFSLKDLQSDSPGSLKVFKNPNASEAEVVKAIERWMRYGSDESGSRFQYGKQLFQQVKGSSSGAGGQSPSTEQSNSQIDSATQQGLDNVRQINDRVSRNAQLSQQYGLAKARQARDRSNQKFKDDVQDQETSVIQRERELDDLRRSTGPSSEERDLGNKINEAARQRGDSSKNLRRDYNKLTDSLTSAKALLEVLEKMPGSEQEVKTLKEVIPKIERNRKHLFEVIEQNEKAHNDQIESLIAEYKKKFEQRKVEALNNRESAKDQLAIEREKNPFAKSRLQLKGDGRAIDFEEKQSQTELDEREKSIRYSLGLRDKAANIQNLQGKAKEEAQAKLARENPEYKFLLESLQGIAELRGINKDTFQARRDTLQSRKDQIDEDEKDAQRSALYQAEDRRSQALREQVRNTLKKEGVSDFLINLKLNDIDLKEGIARIKRDLAETIKELEKAGRLTPEVKKALEDAANVEIGNLPHKFKDLNSTLEEMKQNQFQEFFAGLDGSFKGFFQNVITGTKSIGDSFKELFSNILSRLAQLAIDRIFTDLFQGEGIGGLFKPKKKEGSSTGTNVGMGIAGAALQAFGIKIPAFAEGGVVQGRAGGGLAILGDNSSGYEAVVPLGSSKAIGVEFKNKNALATSNSNAKVEVTINNNGSSQISGSAGGQLGKDIQQAVESVLVQHLRPNGMINRAIRST